MIPFQSKEYTLNASGDAVVNLQGSARAYQKGTSGFLMFTASDGSSMLLATGQGIKQSGIGLTIKVHGLPNDVVTIGWGDILPTALGFGLAGSSGVDQAGAVLPPQREIYCYPLDIQAEFAGAMAVIVPAINRPVMLRRLHLSASYSGVNLQAVPPILLIQRSIGGPTFSGGSLVTATMADTENSGISSAMQIVSAGGSGAGAAPTFANPLQTFGKFQLAPMARNASITTLQQGKDLVIDWAANAWDQSIIFRNNNNTETECIVLALETLGISMRYTGYIEVAEFLPGQTN